MEDSDKSCPHCSNSVIINVLEEAKRRSSRRKLREMQAAHWNAVAKKKKKKKRERERERAKVGVDIIVGDDKRRAKRYETGTEVSLPTNMAAVDLNGQTPKVRSK